MQWSYFPMQRRARQSTLGTRAERSVEARLQENVRPCDDKGWQSRLCIFSSEWRPAMPAERGSSLFSYVFSVFFEYLQTKFLCEIIKFNVVFSRANLINIIKESGSGRGLKRPRFMLYNILWRPRKWENGSNLRVKTLFFKKTCWNIWWVGKKGIPLHPHLRKCVVLWQIFIDRNCSTRNTMRPVISLFWKMIMPGDETFLFKWYFTMKSLILAQDER